MRISRHLLAHAIAGLIVACAVSLMSTAAQAKRIALVIGNAKYAETTPLVNTRNDAADLAVVLSRMDFKVIEGFDLDKRAMERVIRQFDQELAGTELALFFYAGHGIQIGGQNHLVPIDARLSAEGDVDFETLPLNLVLRRMEREAKTSVILLDACRDNPLAGKLSRTMGARSTAIGQGLAEVKSTVGTLISFSTQPGNVALDGDGRNSPYTAALLKEIETPGKDLMSVLASVRGNVVRTTNGRQVPWEHTSLLGPVVLKGAQSVTPPAAVPPQAVVAQQMPSRSPTSEAAEAWPAVKDSTSVATLEAFIRRYGETFHGELAKARLAELQAKSTARPAAGSPPVAVAVPSPSAGTVSQLLCKDVLPFLLETGAFGSKPIKENAYADRVTYFHHGQLGRNDIMRVARDYERKFPTRIYEIDQKTVSARATSDGQCTVAFEYTFLARNAQETREGRGASEFVTRRVGSSFEIISETGRILSRGAK